MTLRKRHRNTITSLLIIVVFTAIVFGVMGQYRQQEIFYNIFMITIGAWIFFVGFGAGIIAVLVRFFVKSYNIRPTFIYNFIGTIILSTGILGLTLAAFNLFDMIATIIIVLSFIPGLFIFWDIYFKKQPVG